MSTFNEFLNHFFKKAKYQKSFETVNTNNLRIVKLYSIVHKEVDDYGRQVGIETAKVVSNYVLVEKLRDKSFRIIPTESFAPTARVLSYSNELHQLVIKKTKLYNRYRKPTSLCPEIANKNLSLEEAEILAEGIASVDSNFKDANELAEETKELKRVCESFNLELAKMRKAESEENLEK